MSKNKLEWGGKNPAEGNGYENKGAIRGGSLELGGGITAGKGASFNGDVSTTGKITAAGDIATKGHLRSGNNRVMRDFFQFNTPKSGKIYVHVKTNIKTKSSIMFRVQVEGYAYGPAKNVEATTVGYTYSGWDCTGAVHNHQGPYGTFDHYCSSDNYIVLRFYVANSYYLGLTYSAWFLNPTGTAFSLEVISNSHSTAAFAYGGKSSRMGRMLGEQTEIHNDDEQVASGDIDAS